MDQIDIQSHDWCYQDANLSKKNFASEASNRVHTIFPKNEDFLKTTQNDRISKNGIFKLLGQTCLYRKWGPHHPPTPPHFSRKSHFIILISKNDHISAPRRYFDIIFSDTDLFFGTFEPTKKIFSKIANLSKTAKNFAENLVKIREFHYFA